MNVITLGVLNTKPPEVSQGLGAFHFRDNAANALFLEHFQHFNNVLVPILLQFAGEAAVQSHKLNIQVAKHFHGAGVALEAGHRKVAANLLGGFGKLYDSLQLLT